MAETSICVVIPDSTLVNCNPELLLSLKNNFTDPFIILPHRV